MAMAENPLPMPRHALPAAIDSSRIEFDPASLARPAREHAVHSQGHPRAVSGTECSNNIRSPRDSPVSAHADHDAGVRRSSSVLDRPRPRVARPSSFFGTDEQQQQHQFQDAQELSSASNAAWLRDSFDDGQVEHIDGAAFEQQQHGTATDQQQQASHAAYYARRESSPGIESTYGELGLVNGSDLDVRGASAQAAPHRSSFYGVGGNDHHATHTVKSSLDASPSSGGDHSRAQTPSSQHHHSSSRNTAQYSAGESSGSFSSQDAPRSRFYAATIPGSRAPSVYGITSPVGDAPPLPAPLLDHSHLQPGGLATLLSHEKTLELYRANAKKTNDPDVQFEFCTFVMEIVGEMEAAEQRETINGSRPAPTEQDYAAKQKQQALVSESVSILNKLATRGHVKSQYFLADCYTQGVGTPKGKRDFDKAFQLFVLASKHGHADACFRAAQCCENGWGCKRDFGKAVQLLKRAAVLNHPAAMHRLGVAEINGELGLSKRPREGVRWLKRAAEIADQVDPPQPQSLHELALLHEKGIENVIFQDEEYAAELLARASELSYPPSAYKLGECYEYGKMGCPQDAALSIHYYNIAAQQNHREACFALTAWYLVGSPGVLPQSDTEAYLWARKAAEMELAKAEYAIGYFTEMGIGTHQDSREALDWFKKAASHGDKRAMDRLRMAGQSHAQPFARRPANSQGPNVPAKQAYKPPQTTRMKKNDKKSTTSLKGERAPRGMSVDQGRLHALPPLPNGVAGRPGPPPRQRSNSFSGGGEHDRRSPYRSEFGPTGPAYPSDSAYASHSLPGPANGYGRPMPQERRLPEGAGGPPEAFHGREPLRQQPVNGLPVMDSYGSGGFASSRLPPGAGLPPGAMRAGPPQRAGPQKPLPSTGGPLSPVDEERRRREVLQKRKIGTGPGEDKDCVVM